MKEKRRFFQFAFSLDLSYLNYELKIIKKIKEKENTSMELKAEIFSGRFDIDQSLENIFETIDLITPIHYQQQPDGTYLVTP